MFETSDEFYKSLGLPNNSMSYDEKLAMIEKPTDGRVVVCHASAWDFCDRRDFRLALGTTYFIATMSQP
jgi:peptidyl-dipeptidase A